MEIKDSPAFPAIDGSTAFYERGISKLEFFACNAPNEIPSWFKHTPPVMEITPRPNWQAIETKEDQELIKCWLDAGADLPDRLKWFQEQFDKHIEEDKAFRLADLQAKYFQWRRFYAEQLLATLSTTQP